MAIHPSDLERQSFPTVRRGFDPAAVRSYLVGVAATMRHDTRLADSSTQPSSEVARNDAKAILLAAQETAESIRADARRQAGQIRAEAMQEAERRLAEAPVALSPVAVVPVATTAPTMATNPPAHVADAERRLQNKMGQLETLRSEVARLHVESGKAVRQAVEERRAAERVRAESLDEITRLRHELNALQARAGTAGVATLGTRVQVPGTVATNPTSASRSEPNAPRVIDTATLTVVDSSATTPARPLVDAVKSAVGRAIDHEPSQTS